MRVAVLTHGAPKGLALGLKRLARCQPFCEGGLDPVPHAKFTNESIVTHEAIP